jgi:hypothetical protein
MRVLLPIKTLSEANLREHWGKRARRAKKQREAARMYVRARLLCAGIILNSHLTISLTRIAPRALDSDNLAGSLKAVRDGIADALGMNDGSPLLEWRYFQTKGRPREYAVLVEITWPTPNINIAA